MTGSVDAKPGRDGRALLVVVRNFERFLAWRASRGVQGRAPPLALRRSTRSLADFVCATMHPDPLFDVLRAYATLQPPKTIRRISTAFGVLHSFLLNRVLLNAHLQEFPPSKQYQVSFWKWAIDWLEQLASDEARYTFTTLLLMPDPCEGRSRRAHLYTPYRSDSRAVLVGVGPCASPYR